MIEVSEIVVPEADEPGPIFHLFDTDLLTCELDADVDLLPVVADATAVGDGVGLVAEGIVEFIEPSIRSIEGR